MQTINRVTRPVAAALALVAWAIVPAVECPAQHSSVPELSVLQNYIGNWDVTLADASGSDLTATVAAEWILDGRFVEQVSKVKDGAGTETLVIRTIMTYDKAAGTYRSWSFTSGGTATQGTGSWDPDKRTMIWMGTDGETSMTITADFARDGEEHWTIATESSSGESRGVIKGRNRRRDG